MNRTVIVEAGSHYVTCPNCQRVISAYKGKGDDKMIQAAVDHKCERTATMKLTLPFPDSRLLPNVKLHWAVKAQAARDAKMLAWVEAIKFRQDKPLQSVSVNVVWFPPDKRRRDEDNYTRATKHYMDGIVGARLIEDDNAKVIKHVERYFGLPDKANPRTEIEIEEVK